MKVIKNYKILKEKRDEYPYIKVLDSEDVFIELPICICEFSKEYLKPVLYGNHNGVPTVHEEGFVLNMIAKLKKFYFKVDGEKLIESSDKDYDLIARLPHDTIVDQLIYDRGQIVWAKPVEGAENNGDN